VGFFPCRGSVVPCRTLSPVSATCDGAVKPGRSDRPFRVLESCNFPCQHPRRSRRLYPVRGKGISHLFAVPELSINSYMPARGQRATNGERCLSNCQLTPILTI
jgi:hypothetical protein